MTCEAAPALLIEKDRLETIGGTFLGIVGDENHSYGYHLCDPPRKDYSSKGQANEPIGQYACAIDIGMDWEESRDWLSWFIEEVREDRIKGISEVIGSFDGYDVRYWSDSKTPDWQQEGVPYDGEGHDTWTHVSIYRSTAETDHGILKGWDGEEMSDYAPLGPPEAVKLDDEVRGDSVMIADIWNGIREGFSPYGGPEDRPYLIKKVDGIDERLTTVEQMLQTIIDALPKPVG